MIYEPRSAQEPQADRRTEPLMPAPQRNDPYKAFNFLVEIDGIAHAVFSEVTGLESETAVIEYRAGGENVVRKLPGLTKFANITLKRGITQDAELWNWRKSIVDGDIDRRNGSIVLLDDKRSPVLRWNFRNGWICKWEGPALSAKSNEVAIETMEIAHEGLELA
jgi:phage tail-like protein